MKNLDSYGVQELNANELSETNGGLLGGLDGITDLIGGVVNTVV